MTTLKYIKCFAILVISPFAISFLSCLLVEFLFSIIKLNTNLFLSRVIFAAASTASGQAAEELVHVLWDCETEATNQSKDEADDLQP